MKYFQLVNRLFVANEVTNIKTKNYWEEVNLGYQKIFLICINFFHKF